MDDDVIMIVNQKKDKDGKASRMEVMNDDDAILNTRCKIGFIVNDCIFDLMVKIAHSLIFVY